METQRRDQYMQDLDGKDIWDAQDGAFLAEVRFFTHIYNSGDPRCFPDHKGLEPQGLDAVIQNLCGLFR